MGAPLGLHGPFPDHLRLPYWYGSLLVSGDLPAICGGGLFSQSRSGHAMLLKVKDAREPTAPSPGGAAVFRGKALLLRLKRMVRDSWLSRVPRHQRGENLVHARVIAESITELWTSAAAADLALQAGKLHNLRLALRRLNGVEAPAGSTFSFWAQVGRPSRWKGYCALRN